MPLPQNLLQSTAAIHAANDFLGQACRELIEVRAERDQLRTALRETREALVAIAFDACSYICPSTGKAGTPIPHSTRCLTVHAVLARHAALAEEVGRG